jgi:hypothetical protein
MAKKNKSYPKTQVEQSTLSWLANNRVDATAEYAKNGRIHQEITDESLRDAWVVSFKEMADDYYDAERRNLNAQFESELTLRGLEPPFAKVTEASQRYVAATLAAFEKMKIEDPAAFDAAAERIGKDVTEYEEKTKRPKN